MADLATLKVRVDAADAVRTTQRLGDALENVAEQGPRVSLAMGKSEAQIRKLQAAEAAAYREADRMAASLNKVEQELKDVDRQSRSTGDAFGMLRKGFAAIAGSVVVKQFIDFADTARLLEGRLKLVTTSAAQLARVQDDLFASAQRTRTSFAGSVELYARVARATQDLGISQRDLLRFTELTNMAIKTSGATSTEASAALIQLSQGLAAGVLRGEEFNSVMEQTPAVAQALAKSLGVGIGELRAMAMQGQLTAQTVIGGILNAEKFIREDFATAPKTVSDAWEQSKNQILRALGELDKATGASSFFRALVRVPGQIAEIATNPFGAPPAQTRAQIEAQNLEIQRRTAFLMTPEGQAQQAAERAQQAEAERARQQQVSIGFMQDYADELVKLSQLSTLNASQLQILRNADASYANALRDGSLAIADRIKLLERQRGVQDVLSAAQQRAATAQSAAGMARLRGTLGAGMVTTVGGKTPSEVAAEGQARLSRNIQLAALKQDIEQRRNALMEEQRLREQVQADLARNFRENMQRAFGDVLTQFVTDGKMSMQRLFGSMTQMGASMVSQAFSRAMMNLMPKNLSGAGSFGLGLGLGVIGMGVSAVFNANAARRAARQRDAAERAAREEANRISAQAHQERIAAEREAKDQQMRDFIAGRTGGRGGVIQSVGQVLQETSASRMIGELVAIRIATTRTADAIAGNGISGSAPTTVNVTVQGGTMDGMAQVGEKVAEAVDRLLGTRVQNLRLSSGQAVTA